MDRSTFYSLGCSGLEEVQSIEPLLSQFHSSLFSSSSQTLERSVQSREINAQLDRDIHLFLRLLSPYLLLRPSLKCLEWLIHRYHVHLYNQDSLVSCVLPFHDSKIFVKVIQLLKIQDSDKWSWLQGLQKPGVPLSRLALVSHCQRDLSFMDFICNMVPEAVQAFSSAPAAGGPQLRVLFSFFASTIVSALDSGTVTDAIITKLLPTVQKGLKSSLVDYRAASLMVLCQLAVKVVMETVLVQSLSAVLCKSLRDRLLVPETMGALIVLFQNQGHAGPTKKSLSRLVSVPDLVSSLESLSQTHDVSPLLRHLLLYLLNCTFSSEPEAGSSAELLEKLLSHVPLTSDLDLTLCSELLDRSLSQDDLSHMNQRLQPVLRVLEVKYYSSVDRTFSSRVSSLSDDQRLLFHQLLSLSATCGKYQMVEDSHSSLLLSLNHPQSSLRVSALQKLHLLMSSGEAAVDLDFLKTSVFDRLGDDEPRVVSAALGLLKLVQNSLDFEDIVSSLLLLLKRAEVSYSENWCPVFSEAVQLLSVGRKEGDSLQRDSPEADLDRLVFRLLPLLVPSGTWESVRFRLSLSLSQSPLLQQHPLTRGWRTDLEVALQSSAPQGPDQVLVMVQTLVSTLSRNIQSMEMMSRHQTLDSLCACVEQLSEFSPGPDLVPLLVLVQTLVLSLRTVSDTHHLLTARRVYRVIERHLQETHRQDMQIPLNLPALGPAPCFSDWLAVFLQRDGQVQSGLVLVSVLWHFIQDLQSPDQSFKGELWWNPERLDNNSCCYLHLLAQMCGLLGGGASHGPITAQYRQLLRLFFKVHLDSPVVLFRFLSLMWSYGGLYGDQVDGRGQTRLGVELQLVALLLGAALLGSLSTTQLQEVVLKTAVFPSVLVVLASPLREMRRAGISVLKSLSAAGSAQYQPITERLLRTSEEVVADCSYLRCALGGLYYDSAHKQEVKESFQKLFQSLVTSQCPCSTSCVLMEALHKVHGQEVLLCLLPALDCLLSQMSPDGPSPLPDECVLLCLLLGKYSAAAAPLLVTDTHCRQLFIQALKTGTKIGTQRVQICALDQV
uniref:HEAT repeat-containing protein 1 n=1 Tax=Knipowitschia caucasica TaxID=637954 RepID=A0AAV2LAY3_KNICA